MSRASKAREKFEKISQRKSNAYLNSNTTTTWDQLMAKKQQQKPKQKQQHISEKFRNELISRATKSELELKSFFDRALINYSFQKIIYVSVDCKQKFYIADFFFKQYNLIVELDGGYHYTSEQKLKDDVRSMHLRRAGYFILRFDNSATLNPKQIYVDIIKFIQEKFGDI